MKKSIGKISLIFMGVLMLSGCSLPLQSSNYPAWKVKNITDTKKNISNKDFPLMWNLDKDKSSYTYAIDDNKKYTVNSNEEIVLNISYELKSNMKKPLAIYYGEVYEDKTDGNSYYFYIK